MDDKIGDWFSFPKRLHEYQFQNLLDSITNLSVEDSWLASKAS